MSHRPAVCERVIAMVVIGLELCDVTRPVFMESRQVDLATEYCITPSHGEAMTGGYSVIVLCDLKADNLNYVYKKDSARTAQ